MFWSLDRMRFLGTPKANRETPEINENTLRKFKTIVSGEEVVLMRREYWTWKSKKANLVLLAFASLRKGHARKSVIER